MGGPRYQSEGEEHGCFLQRLRGWSTGAHVAYEGGIRVPTVPYVSLLSIVREIRIWQMR